MAIRLSGLNSGMDTEGMIKKIMDAERMKLTKIDNKKVKLEWKQDKWKELNTKLYSLYTSKVSNFRFSSAYSVKNVKSSNENIAKVSGSATAVDGEQKLQVKQTATAQAVTGAKIDIEDFGRETVLTDIGFTLGSELTIKTGEWTNKPVTEDNMSEALASGKVSVFVVDGNTTVGEFIDAAKQAGLNANYDAVQKRFYVSSKETGEENSFNISEAWNGVEQTNGLYAIGLAENDSSNPAAAAKTVTRIDAKDAIFSLNGTEYRTATNTNTVNGLTVTLTGTTANYGAADAAAVSINVATDVDTVYNNIRSFVKEYNEILKEMNNLYYAGSAKGYDPLTDEQKKAMSEKDVENWENKIKGSLLRRDDTLGGILNSMKAAMQTSVTAFDGKKYSLASFGIASADYREKGILHIDGDSEDGLFAANQDKLKKALTENPEATAEALKGIMENLYNKMTESMKGTDVSSAMTFYNDKELTKLSETYKREYTTMEQKLNKIEDKYYKQFAAMEKAMSQMNSQNSSLAAMLGR